MPEEEDVLIDDSKNEEDEDDGERKLFSLAERSEPKEKKCV